MMSRNSPAGTAIEGEAAIVVGGGCALAEFAWSGEDDIRVGDVCCPVHPGRLPGPGCALGRRCRVLAARLLEESV